MVTFPFRLCVDPPNTETASVTTARICMVGQAQKEAALRENRFREAANATLATCLEGLADAEQRSLVEGWLAELAAGKE